MKQFLEAVAQGTVIYVAGGEQESLRSIAEMIERGGFATRSYGLGSDLPDRFIPGEPACVVLDLSTANGDGLAEVPQILARCPSLPVIVVMAQPSISECVRARGMGAFDCIAKPLDERDFLSRVAIAVASFSEARRSAPLQPEKASAILQGKLDSLFSQLPIPIALLDHSASYLAANEAFARFLGYSSDELLTLTIADITPPEELLSIGKCKVDALVRGGVNQFRVRKRFIRKDRSVVWAELTLTVICDGDGRVLYAIEILDDAGMTGNGSSNSGLCIERMVPESCPASEATCAISDSVLGESAPLPQCSERLPRLTPRETEILGLLAAGKTLKEIAAQGNVSVQSVWKHEQRILQKFSVENLVGLVRAILEAKNAYSGSATDLGEQTGRAQGIP